MSEGIGATEELLDEDDCEEDADELLDDCAEDELLDGCEDEEDELLDDCEEEEDELLDEDDCEEDELLDGCEEEEDELLDDGTAEELLGELELLEDDEEELRDHICTPFTDMPTTSPSGMVMFVTFLKSISLISSP